MPEPWGLEGRADICELGVLICLKSLCYRCALRAQTLTVMWPQEAWVEPAAAAAQLPDGQHAHKPAAEGVPRRGGPAGVQRSADAGHGAGLGAPGGPALVPGELPPLQHGSQGGLGPQAAFSG